MTLLPGHGDLEVLFGWDEVAVVVVAGVESDPADLAVKGVVAGGVGGGDRGAGVAADVGGLVEAPQREWVRSMTTDPASLAVDVQGRGAALAEAAPVVGELEAHLMRAGVSASVAVTVECWMPTKL